MDKKNYLRVTAELHDDEMEDRVIVWELSKSDVSGEDMLDMLRTIMVGLTFPETVFQHTLCDYVVENHLLEKV